MKRLKHNFKLVNKNQVKLESQNFFGRICDALGLVNQYGVKTKIAKELEISSTAVGLWEEGNVPGIDALKNVLKVAESSGTSIHWLLTGDGEKYVNQEKEINLDDVITNKIDKSVDKRIEQVVRRIVREIIREEMSLVIFASSLKEKNEKLLDTDELLFKKNKSLQKLETLVERTKLVHKEANKPVPEWLTESLKKFQTGVISYSQLLTVVFSIQPFNKAKIQWLVNGSESNEYETDRVLHQKIRSFFNDLIKTEKEEVEQEIQEAKNREDARIINLMDERIQKATKTGAKSFTIDVDKNERESKAA